MEEEEEIMRKLEDRAKSSAPSVTVGLQPKILHLKRFSILGNIFFLQLATT